MAWVIVFFVIFLTAILGGNYVLSTAACTEVCLINGDKDHYIVFGGGCWCQDEDGLYNPKDSRDQPRTETR